MFTVYLSRIFLHGRFETRTRRGEDGKQAKRETSEKKGE